MMRVPKKPGFYWAHFKWKPVRGRKVDHWELVKVDGPNDIWIFGREIADTPENWGIIEFGTQITNLIVRAL